MELVLKLIFFCNYSLEDFMILILLFLKYCFNRKIFILMVLNI